MEMRLQPVCADRETCKCCGAESPPFGVVDFHKNCEILRRKVLDVSGVPIYYHRCPDCGFLFTTAFDGFTKEDFRRHVYNDDYLLVDPDYRADRPRANAEVLIGLFRAARPDRLLDYGGGSGALAGHLRAAGFRGVETYDPFVPEFSDRPEGRFDCVVSYEVVEHSTDPEATLADMCDFLDEPGLILFSTLLQPRDIESQGLNWWYAGPRNGHVSLFSRKGLQTLVASLGYGLASFNQNFHVMYREIPDYARHFIMPLDAYRHETYTTTILAC